eukprot:Blabericola_migrator_1__7344@NODE_3732_length_1548_cov_126_517893_g2305_i1_p1_GENE_NODE_3732_length_1548_cov_126_517893_g2305_i1NODE_3732_length_1548_cov_126_517893_g2305_i1_p1_ORF_typecomplete_len180_score21_38_NODE_3732_length_1548_cov_126_517893_g2305_i1144683
MIEIRGQSHIISEGFKLRDNCYKQLPTTKAQSIVVQMMMNEGQWPYGVDVTAEEQQSLEAFIVADRALRDNLMKFSSKACARSGNIAARTLHFANVLASTHAQFKQRLDLCAIKFLDTTRDARPLIPSLGTQLQPVPASARSRERGLQLILVKLYVLHTTGKHLHEQQCHPHLGHLEHD